MEAEHSKNIARLILGPILEKQREDQSEESDTESSLSAEDEFMGSRLISAIEKKDIKSVVKILRSIKR